MNKKLIVLWLCFLVLVASAFSKIAFAYDKHGYPYNTIDGCTASCYSENIEGFEYGFCQNNCTSYCAYMLNQYGIYNFTNTYLQPDGEKWGNGKYWNDAAKRAGIPVDNFPIPGDIAYWEDGDYGHVAWVEKVYYDEDFNVIAIDYTQYNITACSFSDEVRMSVSDPNYPDGFIHILAYSEGVTSLHYLDCYEMNTLCDNQTREEWEMIATKVWNEYRCRNCTGDYDLAYVNSIAGGFGGSGSDGSKYDPQNYPNLRIYSIGVFTESGGELKEQQSYLDIGKTYAIRVYPISEEENCLNGTPGNIENVETDIFVKISDKDADGSWQQIGRVYTRPSTLTEDNPHKETIFYTIPLEARNKRVYFLAKVDSTSEIHETDEDDNESYWQKEWYPVKGSTDLVISRAQLVGQMTTVPMNSKYRFEMAIRNIETDTPLVGICSGYYLKKPGESVFTLISTDSSDAEELIYNRDQWETSPTTGYFPDRIGIHEVMVCTDIENSVTETDESNNCGVFNFEVVPSPTKAKLLITYAALEEGSSFKKNTRVHPIMRCKNIGDGYPTSSVRVEYRIDGKLRDKDTIEISELSPGREREERVKQDNLKLGDKGNRTLEVRIIVSDPTEIFPGGGSKSFSFRVK